MADQALWLAVIAQAMNDAIKPTALDDSGRNESRHVCADTYQAQARAWFSLSCRDFIYVCNLAQVTPSKVIARYKQCVFEGTKSGGQRHRVYSKRSPNVVRMETFA